MKNTVKYCKNAWERLCNSPFIRYNSRAQNLTILLLGGLLTIAAFDLSSELAKEKGEIDSVIAVMENSIEGLSFTDLPAFNSDLEAIGIIPKYDTPFQTNDVLSLPRDRAPPENI